jgi:hypothetical protein
VAGVDGEHLLKAVNRVVVVFQIEMGATEMFPGGCVAGMGCENLAVKILGFGRVARVVDADGGLELLLDGIHDQPSQFSRLRIAGDCSENAP